MDIYVKEKKAGRKSSRHQLSRDYTNIQWKWKEIAVFTEFEKFEMQKSVICC